MENQQNVHLRAIDDLRTIRDAGEILKSLGYPELCDRLNDVVKNNTLPINFMQCLSKLDESDWRVRLYNEFADAQADSAIGNPVNYPDDLGFRADFKLEAVTKLLVIQAALEKCNNNGDNTMEISRYDEKRFYPWFYKEKRSDKDDKAIKFAGVHCAEGVYHGIPITYSTYDLAMYAGTVFGMYYADLLAEDCRFYKPNIV